MLLLLAVSILTLFNYTIFTPLVSIKVLVYVNSREVYHFSALANVVVYFEAVMLSLLCLS